jgi:hypothetical protein
MLMANTVIVGFNRSEGTLPFELASSAAPAMEHATSLMSLEKSLCNYNCNCNCKPYPFVHLPFLHSDANIDIRDINRIFDRKTMRIAMEKTR